jgi:hypothetical protein
MKVFVINCRVDLVYAVAGDVDPRVAGTEITYACSRSAR